MATKKIKLTDLAKGFGIPAKELATIVNEKCLDPGEPAKKSASSSITEEELDLLLEYMTQTHSVKSFDEYFATRNEPRREKAPAAEKAPKKAVEKKPAKQDAPKADPKSRQQAQQPQQPKKEKPDKPFQPRQMPQKRVIDTSGVTINMNKYDEHIESLVPERAENMRRGKQKLTKKSNNRQAMSAGTKRRQEERDRMQRLQFEIAKKAPVKVQIPDEISVGELASRMKKTGAEVVRQLIKLGVMASLSDVIDYDTAALVAMELGCKVELRSSSSTTTRTTPPSWSPGPPWWWSWATWTTARPPCLTRSARPTWPRVRPAASPSTSALTPWRSTAAPSPSWIPRATRPLPPCAPEAPWSRISPF